MSPTSAKITDHEAILLLSQDVRAVKEGQEKFHQEVKESFKDLKDNYSSRLDCLEKTLNEADKVFVAKAEHDKIDERFDLRITWLERIGYGGLAIIACVEFYFQFLR